MASRLRQAATMTSKQQHSIDTYTMLRKPPATKALKTGLDVKCDILGLSNTALKRKSAPAEEDTESSDETNVKRQRTGTKAVGSRPIVEPSRRSKVPQSDHQSISTSKTHRSTSPPAAIKPIASDQASAGLADGELPTPLTSLLHLHKSILRALTLHIAHNGTIAPISLHELKTSASKIYKKRAVTTTDVLRCYALYNLNLDTSVNFSLYDFGAPLSLCIELDVSSARNTAFSLSRVIDEDALHDLFSHNLLTRWHFWSGLRSPKPTADLEKDAESFIQSLPFTQVDMHPSVSQAPTASSQTLGRSRLEMLTPKGRREKHGATVTGRGGLLTPSSTPSSATDTENGNSSSASKVTPKDRKTGLYARLASKAATAGPKPSVETASKEAERSAALHFLPELMQTLALLSKGKRRSFGLIDLTRTLKESSKTVVEEGVVKRALALLSGEEESRMRGEGRTENEALAPEYIKIVRIGEKALGVVVDGKARPSDLEERIREAIARSKLART